MRNPSMPDTAASRRRSILRFTAPLIAVGAGALIWGAWASADEWLQLQSREKANATLIEKMTIDPVVALDYATDQVMERKIRGETYKEVVRQSTRSGDMRVLDAAVASVTRLLLTNGNTISYDVSWFPTQVVIYGRTDNAKVAHETIASNIPVVLGGDVIVIHSDKTFPQKETSIRCNIAEVCGAAAAKIADYLKGLPDLQPIQNDVPPVANSKSDEAQSVTQKQLAAKNILNAKRIEIFVVTKSVATNAGPTTTRANLTRGRPRSGGNRRG